MPRFLKITVVLLCLIGIGFIGSFVGYREAEVVASRTQPLLALKYMANLRKIESNGCTTNLWAMNNAIDEAIVEYYKELKTRCFLCLLENYSFLNDTKSIKQLLAYRIDALERETSCNEKVDHTEKIEYFKSIEKELQ